MFAFGRAAVDRTARPADGDGLGWFGPPGYGMFRRLVSCRPGAVAEGLVSAGGDGRCPCTSGCVAAADLSAGSVIWPVGR